MPSFSKPANNPLVDLLDEDERISGQKFCCISFLSPENIIKNKDLFLFQQFLKKFDFTKSMEKYEQFLQFIIFKYNGRFIWHNSNHNLLYNLELVEGKTKDCKKGLL